ncbi:MAG TPA: DUF2127 domain-containing protein [Candidatus Saccharimonadales bacterium]
MSTFKATSTLDKVFEGGILIKGASGVIEFITGLVLLFISAAQMHSIIVYVTQDEALEDPKDKIVHLLLHSTQHYGSGSRTFLIIYLWIHATIKLIAVIGILKNQLWAYPFSLIALGILMLYQLYSIVFVRPSIGMILLTVFDVFILWLIWREYGKVRKKVPLDP